MVIRKLLVCASSIAIAHMSGGAFAQDAAGISPLAASPSEDIIVTAQRRAQRLEDVPLTVAVQSAEQLSRAGVVDSRGLQQLTPGLIFQQQSSFLNPSLRGVSTTVVTAGAENPIALYLDNVYVASFAGSILSLPDVQQIEVLKGPQGTLFGRNATGGAIRVFTKEPGNETEGKIDVTGGFYDGAGSSRSAYILGFNGFVSGPIATDKVAASVAFSYRKSNGYGRNVAYAQVSPSIQNAFGNDRTMFLEDKLIRGKLKFTPTDSLDVLLTAYWNEWESDRSQMGLVQFGGTATGPARMNDANGNPYNYIVGTRPWQNAYDAHRPNAKVAGRGASMRARWETGIGELTSTTAWSRARSKEWVDSDNSYSPECLEIANVGAGVGCVAPFDTLLDKTFQQELLFSSQEFGRFSFVAGANYYKATSTVDVRVSDFATGAFPAGDLSVNYPSIFTYRTAIKTKAIGLFAEGTFKVTDKFTAIAGMRYSDEKKTGTTSFFGGPNDPLIPVKGDAWTPRVSLIYEIGDRTNLYATWSKGFKSGLIPGGNASYLQSSPNPLPSVRPEKITAYEVGFKTARAGAYTFNLSAFYYDYTDVQVQASLGAGGTILAIQNAASATIYGLDAEGTVNLSPDFKIRAGASYIPRARYDQFPGAQVALPPGNYGGFVNGQLVDLKNKRLFKTPKFTGNISLSYDHEYSWGKLDSTVTAYYASRQYFDPTYIFSTDEFKLGAEIGFSPANSPFRLALWARNLTNDDAYVSYQLTSNASVLSPGEPRSIGLTGTMRF
ncbi:TonB-dependent receptor [Sphingobium sp. AN558]|uniref:TonB-dependent receptor n=1 Tax=Sphingobium sp. AN558 TaxID=3133442 RepID=UPI0030C43F5D